MSQPNGVESKVREIRRKTRKRYSAEEKIRIVLEGLRGEEGILALCRGEGILIGYDPDFDGDFDPDDMLAHRRKLKILFCQQILKPRVCMTD